MAVAMAGAGADEHETSPPGVDERSVKAGHEPDWFGVRAILYVPALVAITLVCAYVLVTTIFSFIVNGTRPGDGKNPPVEAINNAPINERFARISSTNPQPIPEVPGSKVPQPRLEFMRQAGDETAPPYERSKRPFQEGNPPELTPASLRATNYVDPKTGQRVLQEAGYIGEKSAGLARIPIHDAMHILVDPKSKAKLPVSDHPIQLPTINNERAKSSNGGLVIAPVAVPSPKQEEKKH